MATILGAAVAYGIDAHKKTGALSSWRFLYVIAGAPTIFVAIVVFIVVPDSQLSAKFLSPPQRLVAVERLRDNQQGIGNRKFKRYQVLEMLKDPRTYLYFLIQFIANIGWGAMSTFVSKPICGRVTC